VLHNDRAGVRAQTTHLLAALAIAIAIVPVLPIAAPTAAEPALAGDLAARVVNVARAQLGDPWRYGAAGPGAFDCSGLVTYAYRQAGQLARIGGGGYRSASSLYSYFSRRGRTSRGGGRVGDLVIYGGGSHVGIYLGNGRVISTLTSGVKVHGVYGLYQRFTAFLHTGLSGRVSAAGRRPRPHPAAHGHRHHRPRRVRHSAARPAMHATAAPTWVGSSLGPTAGVAGLGPVAFERTLSDPTGMIGRDVERLVRGWRATVAAQDGVTDARIAGIGRGDRLVVVRTSVASERSWLELRSTSGRRTWVASGRTRR